jgi:hypothetical protein
MNLNFRFDQMNLKYLMYHFVPMFLKILNYQMYLNYPMILMYHQIH